MTGAPSPCTAEECKGRSLESEVTLFVTSHLHNFCCTLTLVKYLASNLNSGDASWVQPEVRSLCRCRWPRSVIAVGTAVEFLLVNTNGGAKWTFPKGAPRQLFRTARPPSAKPRKKPAPWAHRASPFSSLPPFQGCLLAAWRRAGIRGQSLPDGNHPCAHPDEGIRHPTWFSPEEAEAAWPKAAK